MFRQSLIRSYRSLSCNTPSTISRRFPQAARRQFSTPPINDARAARREKLKGMGQGSALSITGIAILAIAGGVGYAIYDINENPTGTLASQYQGSWLQKCVNWIYNSGGIADIFEPQGDKLLPDWGNPVYYPGVPPGSPAPPLLVVDLEKTLIGSTYDSKHGWRHVKRPGLDRFIRDLSPYYEMVIFTENDIGTVQEVLMNIDPEGRCHKLGNSAGEMRGTALLKRLDLMNRDISRIILIDDDPVASQLCPRNTLQVKPYVNVTDKTDTILLDLIPFLQAFVHEGVNDFRDTIDALGTHQAEEAVAEYFMRIHKVKQQQAELRNKGIGGLIRGEKKEQVEDDFLPRSSILSPKDIVGNAPVDKNVTTSFSPVVTDFSSDKKEEPKGPVQKKKGALFNYLDQMEKEKEEQEMRKREVLHRIQTERMMAQQQQQQQ